MAQANRRDFVRQAALTSIAVGYSATAWRSAPAQLQVTPVLSFLMSDNPILAVVDIIEMLYDSSTKKAAPTIADVISRIDGLAQTLKTNFADMQQQFRLILVDALKLNDLRHDTLQLASLSYSLNIAAARGGSEAEILPLSRDVDEVAYRLGYYGVAGSLAYINAIALQNSIHAMLNSSAKVLVQVNKPHDERLGHIIYDGKEPDSLETAIVKKRVEMANDPYYENFRVLKARIGEWYRLGIITRYYEAQGTSSECELRFTYQGFQAGQPVGSRWCEPETNGANRYSGRVVKATYSPRSSSEVYPMLVRSDGAAVFPEGWPGTQVMLNQINYLLEPYKKLYSQNYGAAVSARTTLDPGMIPEHAAIRNYLINTGLESVKKIIKAASQQVV